MNKFHNPPSAKYSITPIGGTKQIGSNMTLITTPDESILIDAGILFPHHNFFNINYLIPDLEKLPKSISSIIITHGHEDHIGAIAHLLTKFPNIQIWAPRFAKALISHKLQLNGLSSKIKTYCGQDTISFEQLKITPIEVEHSIPDTYGLLIQDKDHFFSTLFISDFRRINPNSQQAKKLIDLSKGKSSKLLFVDSTNIERDELSTSESSIAKTLEELFIADRRVFVTLFSSNIERIQNIVDTAIKLNKKIIAIGRSILFYTQTAIELNILKCPKKAIIDIANFNNIKEIPSSAIFLLSGCQGEFKGALRRVAFGDHPKIQLKPSDLFIFSSKAIPGNERAISIAQNKIIEAGATVVNASTAKVHSSGHASKTEISKLIELFNPNHIIPIHGESFHLQTLVDFTEEHFPNIESHLVFNNYTISFNIDGLTTIHPAESNEPRIIHHGGKEITKDKISQRRKIADNGAIFISVSQTTKTVSIDLIGLPRPLESNINEIKDLIVNNLSSKTLKTNPDKVSENIRIEVRRYVHNFLGYKPTTIVHIIK